MTVDAISESASNNVSATPEGLPSSSSRGSAITRKQTILARAIIVVFRKVDFKVFDFTKYRFSKFRFSKFFDFRKFEFQKFNFQKFDFQKVDFKHFDFQKVDFQNSLSLLILNGPLTSPKHPLRIVARAVTNSCLRSYALKSMVSLTSKTSKLSFVRSCV